MSDDYAFECDPSALEDIHTRTSAEDNSEDNDAAHAALESVQLELTEEKQLTFADSDSLIRARHSDGNAAERRLSGWKRKSDESSSTVSIVDDASKKQQKIGKESKLARPVRSVTIAPKSGSMTARSTVTASTQAAAAKAKAAAATVKDGSMTARGSVKEDAASVKDGSQTARSRGGATVVEVRSRYMHINRDKNSINAEKEAKVAKAALLAQQQQQKKLAERKIVTARRSMTASEITSAAAANKKRDDAKAEADVTAQSRRRSATTTELSAQVAKAAVPKLNFSGISAAVEEQKQDGWQYVAKVSRRVFVCNRIGARMQPFGCMCSPQFMPCLLFQTNACDRATSCPPSLLHHWKPHHSTPSSLPHCNSSTALTAMMRSNHAS